VGLGLRAPHFPTILRDRPRVPWFEVLIDNYQVDGGPALHHLGSVRQDYALTFHAVGMNLGGTNPLDRAYLARLKHLTDRFEPAFVSDHLCWNTVNGCCLHDLLPLPYERSVIQHVADRISQVQDLLGRRLLLENVSSYLTYRHSIMEEWEFLVAIVERADCDLLLDVNNIYVSAQNHGFDAKRYLDAIPAHRVRELHLAGYEDAGTHLLDTHGEPVHDPVWDLYGQTLQALGPQPTLIEWDNNIPAFDVLYGEGQKATNIVKEVCRDAA
jgi:hypothetical protein